MYSASNLNVAQGIGKAHGIDADFALVYRGFLVADEVFNGSSSVRMWPAWVRYANTGSDFLRAKRPPASTAKPPNISA